MMASHSKRLANVLMVDDSLPEIKLAEATLRLSHICVNLFSVRNGNEAMQYLRREQDFSDAVEPDMVLLDLNMPEMDGKEVLAAIKANAELYHIPVVIFSGSDAANDVETSKALGAAHYMVKPVSYEKLQAAVAHIEHLDFAEIDNKKYLYRI